MMNQCMIVLLCACALAHAGVVPVSLPYVATVGTSYAAHSINHAVAAPVVSAPLVAAPLAAYSAHPLAYAAQPYAAYPYSAYPYAAYPGHAAYIAG